MPRSCCNRQLGLGNGDSIPSPGDTIFMGRYPTDYSMTDFKDWLVDSHAIGTVADVRADLDYLRVDLLTESGYLRFRWYDGTPGWEYYFVSVWDGSRGPRQVGELQDSMVRGLDDSLEIARGLPSRPESRARKPVKRSGVDNAFIDVVVYP